VEPVAEAPKKAKLSFKEEKEFEGTGKDDS
jgi:hypothetical protein